MHEKQSLLYAILESYISFELHQWHKMMIVLIRSWKNYVKVCECKKVSACYKVALWKGRTYYKYYVLYSFCQCISSYRNSYYRIKRAIDGNSKRNVNATSSESISAGMGHKR